MRGIIRVTVSTLFPCLEPVATDPLQYAGNERCAPVHLMIPMGKV